MPFTYTLGDAENSEQLKEVASVCPGTAQFTSLINEAQSKLWRRGDWWDADWLIRFCVTDHCLTLPRQVSTLLGARFCRHAEATIKNNWFAIIGRQGHDRRFSCDLTITDNGTAPTINPVINTSGSYIRYHVVKAQDYGKTITLYGQQYGGQPLQHLSGNAWVMGSQMVSASPYAQSTELVTHLDSVIRDETQGMAYLYEYNSTTGKQRTLAVYEPQETNPRYRRMKIDNLHLFPTNCKDSFDRPLWQVECLVKLAFIPVKAAGDFLMVDNFDALKYMIQYIQSENANDDATAEAKLTKAVREMNMELREKTPDNQVAMRVSQLGGSILSPI